MNIFKFFLLTFVSIASIEAAFSTKRLTVDDKIEIMQVAKVIANINNKIFSHVEFFSEWSYKDKQYRTNYRDVYRPMNSREIEEEIDRAKVNILTIIKSGYDIFVCSDLSENILYGFILAIPYAYQNCSLIEYRRIYISPAGKLDYYNVMNSMKNFTENFYKNLSIYQGIALKSGISNSSFFLHHGYKELSETEKSSLGFTEKTSIQNNGLIAAALAFCAGVGANYITKNEYPKTAFALGFTSVASCVFALVSMSSYFNNAVYFKSL